MANEYSVKRLKGGDEFQVTRFFKGGFTNNTATITPTGKGDTCVCTCTSYLNTQMPCNHIKIAYKYMADPTHSSYRLVAGQ